MSDDAPHQVTRVLEAVRSGEDGAAERLLELVYQELRQLARGRLAGERPGQTLQPTDLVHEAFLRLFGGDAGPSFENRRHFFGAASVAMRRILVDRARERAAAKRGGEARRVTLDGLLATAEPEPEEILDLDRALGRLAGIDPRMARVVELRYFGGFTVEEAAEILDVTSRTVNRDWVAARAWLERELTRTAE